jgi:hypothetical protein
MKISGPNNFFGKAMVEVFKTNVEQREMADQLLSALLCDHPFSKINFDLEDCDKILRVESDKICVESIIELVNRKGFDCEILN